MRGYNERALSAPAGQSPSPNPRDKRMRGDAHIELKHTACSTKPAAKLGVVLANLQLAEDRLPSFLCCFGSGRASAQLPWTAHKTNFVRDAVFYFDVELELHSLVKQRRRWLNGMNAAYLYLLGHASIVWHSERAAASKYVVVLMLACLDPNMDSMLLANFKADTGEGVKFD